MNRIAVTAVALAALTAPAFAGGINSGLPTPAFHALHVTGAQASVPHSLVVPAYHGGYGYGSPYYRGGYFYPSPYYYGRSLHGSRRGFRGQGFHRHGFRGHGFRGYSFYGHGFRGGFGGHGFHGGFRGGHGGGR